MTDVKTSRGEIMIIRTASSIKLLVEDETIAIFRVNIQNITRCSITSNNGRRFVSFFLTNVKHFLSTLGQCDLQPNVNSLREYILIMDD